MHVSHAAHFFCQAADLIRLAAHAVARTRRIHTTVRAVFLLGRVQAMWAEDVVDAF